MLEKIKTLLKEQELCVLATVSGDKPYCSLMLYMPEEDCRMIYMATQKNTQKYNNLKKNPAVSLLIDSRKARYGNHIPETNALTVQGVFKELQDLQKKESVRRKLMQKHPQDKAFLQKPDVEIFGIKVESFLLLEGLTKAHIEKID